MGGDTGSGQGHDEDDKISMRKIANFAKLYRSLVAEDALTLQILKVSIRCHFR